MASWSWRRKAKSRSDSKESAAVSSTLCKASRLWRSSPASASALVVVIIAVESLLTWPRRF